MVVYAQELHMQEINEEDRIIGKIYRGELSIVDRDIKNLATANLSVAEEENFRQLAQEINETIDRNRQIRKEMEERVAAAEQKHKAYLENIDEKIVLLKEKRDKLKYGNAFSSIAMTMCFLAAGFIPGIIASAFTQELWVILTAAMLGAFTGFGVVIARIYKNSLKADKFEKQIRSLEQERLEVLEGKELDASRTQEYEVKHNIVKHIYKSKNLDAYQDELEI